MQETYWGAKEAGPGGGRGKLGCSDDRTWELSWARRAALVWGQRLGLGSHSSSTGHWMTAGLCWGEDVTLAVGVGRVTTEGCPPSTLPELKRVWGPRQRSAPTQGLGSSSRLCLPQGGLQTPA